MIQNDEEIIIVVDKDNNIIGEGIRSEMRRAKQIHRSSFVMLITENMNIFIQKRSKQKSWCPGYWDIFFGGVVSKDETYLQTAERELYEEVGLQNQKFEQLFDMYFENERTKAWVRVIYNGSISNLKLCPIELEAVELKTIEQIQGMQNNGEAFTPDGNMGFQLFLQAIQYKL